MQENFDLTTKDGFSKAVSWFNKWGFLLSPGSWLIYKVFSPEITTEKQLQTVEKLIVAGRKNGAKRMKIKVGHNVGVDIGTNINGIPVKVKIGNDGFAEIEVEYK